MSVTETICAGKPNRLPIVPMDNEPWQRRLRALGLKQSVFARAVGRTPTNLSAALRGGLKGGVPRYLVALIVALEMLTPEQRADWLDRMERGEHS